jgi:effector-binding domain-containing protein
MTRKEFPCRFYIPIGTEELLYRSDHFYLYPTIVFYRGLDKQFGAMLNDITSDELELMKPKRIAEGEFYCGYHNGPYDLVTDTFDRIRHQAESEGIRLAEEALNINIIDQFIESDSDKYITEIQFRIL